MLDTVLFDLDGTLLPFFQDAFVEAYFRELGKKFVSFGLEAEKSIQAVWAGTKAMLKNDGSVNNATRFWDGFAAHYGGLDDKRAAIEAGTDLFYENEFNRVREVAAPTTLPRRIIDTLKGKGYTVALATNPLFPPQAVASRLSWIGLELADFALHTDYLNSRFCKPNPGYYRDIYAALGKEPEQCLMVGNTVLEDMSAAKLGSKTYLVTDYLENPEGSDTTLYPQGTLAGFADWADGLPNIL